ncbi:uncharacterized protein BDW47DRAFT_122977 [Aspergillus candidus]|uniref:Uncharacterized protein n=1 Tax=Aspergillus candidus TaxID=41067 RepID=A0A2I2FJU5_ASPCN|nr:hypothetical protein BDW47DRAFT_122977 [Aspergillus candidus]PLB40905.1 hypothetical protein BDW47DRAFT_122977 [Aspergillus candidus]
MSDPTGSPASAAAAVVTNPSNPQQTATFVKEEASDDLLAALPLIPAAGLPLIVSVGGSAVPAVVDSAGMIVRPLGSAPSWIKPDIFPAADSIGETLNPGKTVPVGSGSGGGAGTGSGGGSESGSGDGAGSGSGGGNESESDTESSSGSNTESGSGAEPTGSSSSTSPEESSTTEPESSSTEPPGETLATRTITITTDINTFRAIPNFPIITGSGRPADTPGASNTQNDSQPSKTDNNSQPTNTDNNSQPSNNENNSQSSNNEDSQPSNNENNSQPPNNENNSQPSNTENNSQPSNTENASQTSNLQPMYTPDPSLTTVDSHGNGTKIHVDSGCISVNGQTICGHWDLATVRTDAETSKVKIYGKFDSEDAAWYNKKGGCELTASWPSEYGDVRYQDDNCLHDADGNIIDNQCCTEPAKDDVPNPYGPICKREYSFSVDQVTIYSSGWMTDDGSNLWKQMSRCGPVTKWEVNPVRNQAGQKWVYFHLPIQIGGSCVQQGIWEAGGPWANC